MKTLSHPRKKHTLMRGLLVLLCSAAFIAVLSGHAEATSSYRHMCKKCEVSVVDKRKTGPTKVKCPKGGFHVWKNVKVTEQVK